MAHASWEAILSAAVLGTERQKAVLPTTEGGLGRLLSHCQGNASERMLLHAAALLSAFQRAGQLPAADGAQYTLESAAPEERQECSARAAQHLLAMLGGTQRDLLGSWLEQLAQLQKRVPARCLPELLDAGRNQPALRSRIRSVIGVRGHWLAAQNPAWAYAAQSPIGHSSMEWSALTQQWETAMRSERLALLEELRLGQPDHGRNLVVLTWPSEKADDRASFLAALASGLTMDDEPFLEAALDDRSKEVRTTAVQLLCQLPRSRLVQRMIARTAPLLHWSAPEPARLLGLQKGRSGMLTINLPESCDKPMARDGVEPKPVMQHQKLGEKAQWMLQMLRTIPPRHWCDTWNTTPAELLAAAGRSEWKAVLEAGWISATQSSADPEWAEAFLRSDPTIASLLVLLPAERQEALLLELLAELRGPFTSSPVLALLQQTQHPWSATLSRAVLRAIHQHMHSHQGQRDYQLLSAFDSFARSMPPSLTQEVAAGWATQQSIREHWQGAIDRMLITLQFRHDLATALAE